MQSLYFLVFLIRSHIFSGFISWIHITYFLPLYCVRNSLWNFFLSHKIKIGTHRGCPKKGIWSTCGCPKKGIYGTNYFYRFRKQLNYQPQKLLILGFSKLCLSFYGLKEFKLGLNQWMKGKESHFSGVRIFCTAVYCLWVLI